MKDSKSRRDFLKTTVAGATAAAIASTASSYGNILGSNDKVRVGIVGFSDRAKDSLIPAFMKYANELKFEIVAVSDIWKLRREEGAEHLSKITGKKVDMCRNNDELYDRKDVDAVIAATADFQHAQHCIEAVKAGRDCYVEKPFANTMEDAREALKVVSASNKIVQIGTQRRSTKAYMNAFDFIKQGKFGDIIMVEMSWNVNQPGRWRRPKLVPLCKEGDVDWKRYLINRPYEPFDPRKYVEFRLFWPYSSGIPCQWMVHQIDTVHWFTGLKNPTSVVVNGGLYFWRDGRKNFDTLTAVFDYGDAAKGRRSPRGSCCGKEVNHEKKARHHLLAPVVSLGGSAAGLRQQPALSGRHVRPDPDLSGGYRSVAAGGSSDYWEREKMEGRQRGTPHAQRPLLNGGCISGGGIRSLCGHLSSSLRDSPRHPGRPTRSREKTPGAGRRDHPFHLFRPQQLHGFPGGLPAHGNTRGPGRFADDRKSGGNVSLQRNSGPE